MLKEYSKAVITAMIIAWFLTGLYGAVCVWTGHGEAQLSSLLEYIGMPMTGGIVGYLAKAGFENREKIKQSVVASSISEEVANLAAETPETPETDGFPETV